MKHRKLKGRKKKATTKKKKGRKGRKVARLSLTNLNETGAAAAKAAKEAVNAEKKAFNKQLSAMLSKKVKEAKARLKNASQEERDAAVQALKDEVAKIKEKTNAYFKEKYAQEVDKIKADKNNLK